MNDLSQRLSQMSPLKLAFAAQKMRSKLAVLYAEPIAVVGLGCRFPGGADDPERFWQLLRDGVDAIREVPEDRFPIDELYDPDPDAQGKLYTRFGGFVEHLREFEPQFFGISPREAVNLDPQHRLLLEVSWEALENAGLAPDQLAGSQTGVFIGICGNDYQVQLRSRGLSEIDAYMGTGTFNSVASGRLSYFYGFQGPSISLDTACSSSLVAIHLAVSALRNGECNLALVGGVNRIYSPDVTLTFSKSRMLAPDGRCKTFDAAANGYVRSEGCGVVVLKRLSDALTDRDNIVALIRGSAVNQDGRVSSLTVPNGPSQQAVIRQALKNGGVLASQVSYVEAHGTGTSLGDPIEMGALKAVFAQRPRSTPLQVGSLKTNIGHLEGAAGIAGLMKVVLSLKHKKIVPHLHFNKPSPYIDWDQWPVEIPTQLATWDAERRIAGVSSFGFSGTNAHVVLEEAPELPPSVSAGTPLFSGVRGVSEKPTAHLFTLSARSQEALAELAGRYASYLSAHPELTLADVCFTVQSGRAHFDSHVSSRLSLVTTSRQALIEQLAAFSHHDHDHHHQASVTSLSSEVRQGHVNLALSVAFLFTGQGSQYVGMGRDLYQTEPIFRQIIDHCDKLLRSTLKKPLRDVLYRDRAAINQTAYTQPALFAFEYALAKLWESWGIKPNVVMGHSVGEYVAACLAGVFSLEDGLKLMAERGRLMQVLPSPPSLPPNSRGDGRAGTMVAVFASEAEVEQALKQTRSVSIAAINGPQSVVISGERQAIRRVVAALEAKEIKTKPLTVSHAFHSPLMEPMLRRFERMARQIPYSAPKIEIISNVTGEPIGEQIANAQYWVRHVRQPVRFMDGMQALAQKEIDVFLEIGPKPTLLSMGQRCLADYPDYNRTWLPSLRPGGVGNSERSQLLSSLGELYVQGAKVDFVAFNKHQAKSRRRVVLPTYPWKRERYWVEKVEPSTRRWDTPPPLLEEGLGVRAINRLPLLGQRHTSALAFKHQEILFTSQLSISSPAYLAEHRVFGQAILPATAYLEMALAAGAYVLSGKVVVEELLISQAMKLHDKPLTVQFLLTPFETGYWFEIFSQTPPDSESWTRHAKGQVVSADVLEGSPPVSNADLATLQARCGSKVPLSEYYQQFAKQGIEYGPQFRALEALFRGDGEALGRIRLPDSLSNHEYQLHPVLLDACLQVVAAAIPRASQQSYLPVGIERLTLYGPFNSNRCLWSHAGLRVTSDSTTPEPAEGSAQGMALTADLQLFSKEGQLYGQMEGLQLKRATRQAVLGKEPWSEWLYEVVWHSQQKPVAASEPFVAPNITGDWLILADRGGIGQNLAKALSDLGMGYLLVYIGQTYERLNGDEIVVNPNQPADWQRLLLTAGREYRGVVHLWSLEESESSVNICAGVLHLIQALTKAKLAPRLWLGTFGAQSVLTGHEKEDVNPVALWQAPLWGLGKVIALEHPEFSSVCLDLAPVSHSAETVKSLVGELLAPDKEKQVAYRKGVRHVARLERYRSIQLPGPALWPLPRQRLAVKLSSYGTLDNLSLLPITSQPLGPEDVEIEVRASGLNFRDVLRALGMMREVEGTKSAADLFFGFECAGVIKRVGEKVEEFKVGDSVIAAMTRGSLASVVMASAKFVVLKPPEMSFEEAATIPVTFLTAYYGLVTCAKIRPTDRVLIHAAAGGVGQAAVQLAQSVGAEVLATASKSKWEYLKQAGLDASRVMNSRSLEFAAEVMALTNGEGVDVVLNSLNGEFIDKSFEVLAKGGRFVEIGKLGIWDEQKVRKQRTDAKYFPFDLGEIERREISSMLAQLMAMFREGTVNPLPLKAFPVIDVVSAFRYMQQAKHIGKVVLTFPQTVGQVVRQDGSYLITGGLGALGLQVAQWLVKEGAQHLVLTGRSRANQAANFVISQLEQAGAKVSVVRADVVKREDVKRLLAHCPNLRGIVHAAGVLDDGLLLQQTKERFAAVMAPKVQGAWNLHLLTQDMSGDLDFFVLFSSAASLIGSAGQGNYAAANAFMDALAHHRQALGLPALSINWGAWAEVGMAADLASRLKNKGLGMIAPEEGLQVLEKLLSEQERVVQVGVLPLNLASFTPRMNSPYFEALTPDSQEPNDPQFLKQLENAPSHKRRGLLRRHLRAEIGKVLGLHPQNMISSPFSPRQRLFDLGLDSLMAVELKNRLEKSVGRTLRSTLLFDFPTLEALENYLAKELELVEESQADNTLEQLNHLSQEDIADLLAKKLAAIKQGEKA